MGFKGWDGEQRGQALDECLWFELRGMSDLKRRGFLCSAACVALKTKETTRARRPLSTR